MAGNAGPLTLDGTRSYIVGRSVVVVIDPGPPLEEHLQALATELESAAEVRVVVTHAHGDHAGGAAALAERTGGELWGPGVGRDLRDGQELATDWGPVVAVSTPGHSRRHFCFRHPATGAVFTGDLILGEGDTTWVGEYSGAVAEYLSSLDAVESLGARVLYPGHGPPLADPAEAVARYRTHRLRRIEQVRRALAETGTGDPRELARTVYGDLPPELFEMATAGVRAAMEYIGDP